MRYISPHSRVVYYFFLCNQALEDERRFQWLHLEPEAFKEVLNSKQDPIANHQESHIGTFTPYIVKKLKVDARIYFTFVFQRPDYVILLCFFYFHFELH